MSEFVVVLIRSFVPTQWTCKHRFLEDYCDAETFKKHPLFSLRKGALQLFFYYDDLEICNPLGSKTTIHKIGMAFYCACVAVV